MDFIQKINKTHGAYILYDTYIYNVSDCCLLFYEEFDSNIQMEDGLHFLI